MKPIDGLIGIVWAGLMIFGLWFLSVLIGDFWNEIRSSGGKAK